MMLRENVGKLSFWMKVTCDNCILSRSQLDEREANEKFLEAMLLIADVRDVKEEEDSKALRSWLSSQN